MHDELHFLLCHTVPQSDSSELDSHKTLQKASDCSIFCGTLRIALRLFRCHSTNIPQIFSWLLSRFLKKQAGVNYLVWGNSLWHSMSVWYTFQPYRQVDEASCFPEQLPPDNEVCYKKEAKTWGTRVPRYIYNRVQVITMVPCLVNKIRSNLAMCVAIHSISKTPTLQDM